MQATNALTDANVPRPDGLAGNDAEPDFDLVDPGRAGWCEVERHPRIVGQPVPHLGGAVRRAVVQHDVNILACMWLDGRLQEGQKVRAAAGRLALAAHLTGADVERGEQVRRAVPNVVVR